MMKGSGSTGSSRHRVPDLSRSRVRDLIKDGQVSAGGRTIIEPDYRVKSDEIFAIGVPEPVAALPEAEHIPLNVLYEDSELIVIDKPAGLVVHPAAGNWTGTLVNALIAHCGDSLSGIGGVRRPGIVHRLDKDTTGVMVVAKTDAAHQGLAAAIRRSWAGRRAAPGISRAGLGRAETAQRRHRNQSGAPSDQPAENGGHQGATENTRSPSIWLREVSRRKAKSPAMPLRA